MNALEAASLVMIPSGYEDGTLGSLKPTDGTGDFTFSRGSNISATRVNADGNIEKGYENLLLQSNSFDTTWTTFEATPTSGQAGYDGSNDAWQLTSINSVAGQRVQQTFTAVSGVYNFSCYAKAGNYNQDLYFRIVGSTSYRAYFDLSDGSIQGGSNLIDYKSTDVGNGWYKFEASFNVSNAHTFEIRFRDTNDAGSYFYIQDAMINQGLVAYPYVETTTAPVAGGILEDMPRLDYSGSCPALLLEPQRTNVLEQSEYGFGNFESTKEQNATTSPEGYENATSLIDNANNQPHLIYPSVGTLPAGNYTASVFLKRGTQQYGGLRVFTDSFSRLFFVLLDLETGNVVDTEQTGSGTWNYDVENYNDGWYRVWISSAHTSGSVGVAAGSSNTAAPSYSINAPRYIGDSTDAMYVYGFQVEQDATYPTSYIPTYGVSQTRLRAVDAAVIDTPIVFNADDDFTFFIDLFAFRITNLYGGVMAYGGRPASQSYFYISFGRTIIRGDVGDMFRSNSPLLNANEQSKLIFNRSSGVMKMFYNGQEITDTTTNNANQSFTFNSLGNAFSPSLFYSYEGTINQFLVFPSALSDEACIELTTI